MPSVFRQKIGYDPAPLNQTGTSLGGAGPHMLIAFPQATLAGSTLLGAGTVSFFAGTTVTGISDSVNGAWPPIDALQTSGNCDCRVFGFPNAASVPAGDFGIATSGSATAVGDTTKSWTTNQWVGAVVFDLAGNTRTVTSNTSNTLTVSSGTTISTGGWYVVGGWVKLTLSAFDDYNGIAIAEVSGVTSSIAGHHAATSTVGSGTNNVSSGSTSSLAAGSYGVWGFSFNDTSASGTKAPAAGTGQQDEGGFWVWDIGQTNARMQFKNTTLASAGPLSSLFSSNGSDEYLTFAIALLDSAPSAPSYGHIPGAGPISF